MHEQAFHKKRDNPDISDHLKTSLFFTTPLMPVILYFSTTLIQLYFVLTFFVYAPIAIAIGDEAPPQPWYDARFYETFR